MDRTTEAYALGYFFGRAIGSDEPGFAELERRGWDDGNVLRAAFKDGYERGVSDFCEYDDEDEDEPERAMPGEVLPPNLLN